MSVDTIHPHVRIATSLERLCRTMERISMSLEKLETKEEPVNGLRAKDGTTTAGKSAIF